jgi:hypothetical protein
MSDQQANFDPSPGSAATPRSRLAKLSCWLHVGRVEWRHNKVWKMTRTYYKLPTVLLLAIMLVAAPGVLRGQGSRVPRQDRCKDGVYNAKVGGYYSGTGTADVAADRVILSLRLKKSDGTSITLNGTFPTNGPYFGGTTQVHDVNNPTVTVRGRVDAARASRVVATYWVADTGGRIYGVLPSDPGDETWNQDK